MLSSPGAGACAVLVVVQAQRHHRAPGGLASQQIHRQQPVLPPMR